MKPKIVERNVTKQEIEIEEELILLDSLFWMSQLEC